jgi:hypothetical protein
MSPTIDTGDASRAPASAIVQLTADRRHELLMQAQYAGASENMLLDLKRKLKDPRLTTGMLDKIEARTKELATERTKRCKPYWVKDGSSVFFAGTLRKPGNKLLLTEEEAEAMAACVTGEAPPPPQPKAEARVDGQYRVCGPGSVFTGGKLCLPLTLLELTAEEACSLGEAVEYVHPEG